MTAARVGNCVITAYVVAINVATISKRAGALNKKGQGSYAAAIMTAFIANSTKAICYGLSYAGRALAA